MSSASINNASKATREIYEDVIRGRLASGKAVLGFGTSEVFKTPVGMYGPTVEGDLDRIVSALGINSGNLHVLDLGSGTGQLVMPLALLNPGLSRISGIEFDSTLVEENSQAIEIAIQRGLIRPGQVQVHQGDFFDPRFEYIIRTADRIFYYLSSSDDEDRLGYHLGNHIATPGAKLVAYGDNQNPFPMLQTEYGFSFCHSPESLITIYFKM